MILSTLLHVALGLWGLSFVVLIHEAGHFAAARAVGIHVLTFSIGFGRKIVGFRHGGTEFRLSLIPLGGYCRFAGEQPYSNSSTGSEHTVPVNLGDFYAAVPWKRILVVIAGPLANVIFAVCVFTSISWIGYTESYIAPRIVLASEWDENERIWPADKAGLRDGDVILEVDGKEVRSFSTLRQKLIFRPGEAVDLTVLRDGHSDHLTITPELEKKSGTALIGVLGWVDPVLDSVAPGSAAGQAGLRTGDKILSIDQTAVSHTVGLSAALDTAVSSSENPVPVKYRRGDEIRRTVLDLRENDDAGWRFAYLKGRSERLGPLSALGKGLIETGEIFLSTVRGIKMLFLGTQLQSTVSGPARLIFDTGSIVIQGFRVGIGPGLLWSFQLMALISISLAFINLFPIPVLDGGQILLFLVESIKGRALNPKTVSRYQIIGVIIVLVLVTFATVGDIVHFRER